MRTILCDRDANTIGVAQFSVIPRIGDTIALHLFNGGHSRAHGPPLQIALFRCEHVAWEAYNMVILEGWMRPFLDGRDAQATLTVSALDAPTQAYLERMKEVIR